MKKLFTRFLLVLACLAWAGSAWAATATIDINADYKTLFPNKGVSVGKVTDGDFTETTTSEALDGFTLTIEPSTGNTPNRLWKTTKDSVELRLYGGSLTITAPQGATMTAIDFTADKWNSGNKVNVGTLSKRSWTGSANSLTLSVAGNTRLQSMEITYENGGTTVVEAPTFTPAAQEFEGSIEVSLASATEGASIYYTLDGTEPSASSTLYSAPFSLSATTTVKAIAIKGDAKSSVAEATYTLNVATLKELNAVDEGTSVKYTGNASVAYQNGRYLYLQDASGYALVYGDLTQKYALGDVITGFEASKKIFNTLVEFTPVDATFTAGTAGQAVEPKVITIADVNENLINGYVLIKNVNLDTDSELIDDADNTLKFYNQFHGDYYNPSIEVPTDQSKKYDVKGFITSYNGKLQFYPTEFTENVPSGVDGINSAKTVASEVYTDLAGRRVSEPANGFFVKTVRYTDGTVISQKVVK